jgi:hypothetical protein
MKGRLKSASLYLDWLASSSRAQMKTSESFSHQGESFGGDFPWLKR